MKINNSTDLLKALEVLRDLDEFERTLGRILRTVEAFVSIDNEMTRIQNLLTAFVDSIDPARDKLTSLHSEFAYLKEQWAQTTRNGLPYENVSHGSLSFRSVEREISDSSKEKAREIRNQAEALRRICSILSLLNELVEQFNEIKEKLLELLQMETLTEEEIGKIKTIGDELNSLVKEAEKLGVDSSLLAFLENASSQYGTTLEDVSKNIFRLLEEHDLKKLISVHLSEQT